VNPVESPWDFQVKHDPRFFEEKVADPNFTKDTMERFSAVVQNKVELPQHITNQVVADELLRARIRSGGGHGTVSRRDSWRDGSVKAHDRACQDLHPPPQNPGSRGHPEFCPRPCAYYFQNFCKSGNDCNFCHHPHPKRPMRFDKQHRDELKRMPFAALVSLVLPVLRLKVKELELKNEATELLEALWPKLGNYAVNVMISDPSDLPRRQASGPGTPGPGTPGIGTPRNSTALSSNCSVTSGETRSSRRQGFSGAFQHMGFRSLLVMLTSRVPSEDVSLHDLIDQVLAKIRVGEVNTRLLEERPTTADPSESSWWPAAKSSARRGTLPKSGNPARLWA